MLSETPPEEAPAWVEDLFTHQFYTCIEPEYVHVRVGHMREWMKQIVHSRGDWPTLRRVCRQRLTEHDDPVTIERALNCLFVGGTLEDTPAIEPLLAHQDERVRKVARTALFEIRHRRDEITEGI